MERDSHRTLYSIWFVQILSITGFSLAIPFLPFFIPELGDFTPDEVKFWTGITSAGPALGLALMAPIWGFLTDKFSPKIMLLRAFFTGGIVLIGLGMTQTITQLLILRITQGLFTGTIGASATWVAITTPNHRLASALGFLSSSTFIGVLVGPALGGVLADTIGYRQTFFVGGTLLFLGFFAVLFFLKNPKKDPKSAVERVRESENPFQIRTLFIILILFFFFRFLNSMLSPFLPIHLQELLPNSKKLSLITGFVVATVGAVVTISNLTLPRLGDRYPKNRILVINLLFTSLFASPLYFFHDFWHFVPFYLLVFFFIGSCEPLITSQMAVMVDAKHRGKLFGLQASIGGLGWFAAPMTSTWVAVNYSTFSLYGLFSLSALVLAAGLLLYSLSRRSRSTIKTS